MKAKLTGLIALVLSSQSMANSELESLKNISQELVRVRQQIETLHNQINFEKESHRDQLRSYSNQKSDLDVKISRADLNIQDLQRELNKLAELNAQKNQASVDIKPILKQSIATLTKSVADSVPFKLEQRLQALKDIENRMDSDIISPNKAANQLWAFVEDELILGRSSGIYNDTIEVDGQLKLVKVLRVGKIAMYFRTQENEFGVLKKTADRWQQNTIHDKDQIVQMEKLFDSFNKNIRNGIFTVPNLLPSS